MKIIFFSLASLLACCFLPAQQMPELTPDTLIIGPEKYTAEVIRIIGKYSHITDSLFNLKHSTGYKPQNDKKYNSYDGEGGYYMDLSFQELEIIIKKFLDIKCVKGTFNHFSGTTKETYYEVSFEGNNKDLKYGKVRWYLKDEEN